MILSLDEREEREREGNVKNIPLHYHFIVVVSLIEIKKYKHIPMLEIYLYYILEER